MLMSHKLFVQLDSVCLCSCLLVVVQELAAFCVSSIGGVCVIMNSCVVL